EDTAPPVMNCNAFTIYLNENGGYELNEQEIATITGTVTDNCTPDDEIDIQISKTTFDCTLTGSTDGVFVTITATDLCGNSTTCETGITVVDTISPVVNCTDITGQLDANRNFTITVEDINNGSTDNCEIDTMYIDKEDFSCDNLGENEVTLTVIDVSGNVGTCTAIVTIEQGDADCGKIELRAVPDILTLIVCPGGKVAGDINLLANDIGVGNEGVSITTSQLPDLVSVNITDGTLNYISDDASEAVITFTYTICHKVNTENCSEAEVTIQLLLDSDCDGVPDVDDIDDDDDGILDVDEEANALNQETLDSDGDGIVDRLDIDSDNDGISDNVEWQLTLSEGGFDDNIDYIVPTGTDTNGDGWDDAYDGSAGGTYYEAVDTDGDDTPDYLDLDTDGDGIPDWLEGHDANLDSIADTYPIDGDFVDSDNDGLDDRYDNYDTSSEWLNGKNAIGSNAPIQDSDNDGERDWRDYYEFFNPASPEDDCEFFIPNGFSPNDDGINDYFEMDLCDLFSLKIEIFNRWGNLVYEKENYGNVDQWGAISAWWDGRSSSGWTVGKDRLPPGTYFYILYLDNGNEPKAGSIFLNK
ncbi:MAG: gliding motility-associated C-terminal domain-containing protein, partial [Draconibacterium sp.]|nr:gliding motility-associated C-terminal domain-containing protein [Draconibacterium sp.]